jgi:hypothetical protein
MEKLKQLILDCIKYYDEMQAIGRGIDLDSFLKSHPLLGKDLELDGKIRCKYCGWVYMIFKYKNCINI